MIYTHYYANCSGFEGFVPTDSNMLIFVSGICCATYDGALSQNKGIRLQLDSLRIDQNDLQHLEKFRMYVRNVVINSMKMKIESASRKF